MDKIASIIYDVADEVACPNNPSLYAVADKILALPELAELQRKAGLWDRVKEQSQICDDCPAFFHDCCSNECPVAYVVDALEGQS